MKKLTLVLFSLAVLLIYSCSKDQKAVNNLEGDWKVTSVTIDGVADTADYSMDKYTFEKCKLSKGDCPGTYTTVDPTKGEVASSFTYSFEDDGETLIMNIDFLGTPITTTGKVIDHTDSKFSWSENGDQGEVIVTELTKA
jgi:hypothetical protein